MFEIIRDIAAYKLTDYKLIYSWLFILNFFFLKYIKNRVQKYTYKKTLGY